MFVIEFLFRRNSISYPVAMNGVDLSLNLCVALRGKTNKQNFNFWAWRNYGTTRDLKERLIASKSITWFYLILNIYKFGSSYTSWFTKHSHSLDTWIVWKGKTGRIKWNSWYSLHNFFLKHWDNILSAATMSYIQEWLLLEYINWDGVGGCSKLNCVPPNFMLMPYLSMYCPSWYHIPHP